MISMYITVPQSVSTPMYIDSPKLIIILREKWTVVSNTSLFPNLNTPSYM